MTFALERFKEQIIVNEAFRDSLAEELISNHLSEGTILLVANEILFEPGFNFTYAANGHGFPGRFDIIIVADRFDSRGGTIDLTGHYGGDALPGEPPKADNGAPAFQESENDIKAAERGKTGHTGNIGGTGGHGMNIKVFCDLLVNIQITTNGGKGGRGGQGGEGGNGGEGGEFEKTIGHGPNPKIVKVTMPNGKPGKGGRGGPGGPGGNAGKIELLHCNHSVRPTDPVPSVHLVSDGGGGGGPGSVGRPGKGHPAGPFESGDPGVPGAPGSPSTPDVKVVGFTELWERVSIELGLSP
jgi:hypothetical protein